MKSTTWTTSKASCTRSRKWELRIFFHNSCTKGRKKRTEVLSQSVTHQLEESAVNASIAAQLRMKGGGHRFALTDKDGIASFIGQNFDIRTEAGYFRRADEDHLDGGAAEEAVANRAVDLASIGIAANADVEGAKACLLRILHVFRQENCSRAGAERRLYAD